MLLLFIGYGNLHPTSCTGRILVLVYSLIGIPLNGIVLTQLGSFFESRVSVIIVIVQYLRNC